MEQMLEAVFENETFRLLEPSAVTLVDGQHVRLMVEPGGTPGDVLALAEQMYDGLSHRLLTKSRGAASDT